MTRCECELCGRENDLNFHHLIPVTFHKNKWYKKRYTRGELQKGIYICEKDCHKQIHVFITEKEMGRVYNTLEKLLEHPKVIKYIKWIKNR